ncbi:glycosyltransferase family 2 protein [Candidatus Woesearchaeota archaeon]|nr:MAG: glycosyltransferase family 2 protein [Candidatus Woesearchaeota archaeon]
MIEYVIWVISFLGLFVSVFWIQVAFASNEKKTSKPYEPNVSFLVPAWNEEKTLRKTVESILNLDYPKEKIEIVIVNDGSVDNTQKIGEELVEENKDVNIKLINRTRSPEQFTKAPALNEGLKHVTGEYVACLDSDSTVEKNSLKKIFEMFDDEKTAAVISAIKVANPYNIFAKIQRLEYILATFVRKLMSKIDTLHITPGALSVYKTDIVRQIGGFDEKNITEDYEIAMRLRYNGYRIKIQPDSISYTNVPDTFKTMWNQRVRWFRGFIMTSIKYKDMFANKKFGMMGTFQYPINIISFFAIILMFVLFVYEISLSAINLFTRFKLLGLDMLDLIKFPTLRHMLLSLNLKITFPLTVSFLVALYIYYLAHKTQSEKIKHPLALLAYFTVYPPMRTAHWITATYKEMFKRSKKW